MVWVPFLSLYLKYFICYRTRKSEKNCTQISIMDGLNNYIYHSNQVIRFDLLVVNRQPHKTDPYFSEIEKKLIMI
jgi:hypothetical protein